MTEQTSFTVEVGRLLCGRVREILEGARFRGLDIEYREGRGLLSKPFDVRGSSKDVIAVSKAIMEECWGG